MFRRYVGVDYSGAGLPMVAVDGIQVITAQAEGGLELILGANGGKWSRAGLASWLAERLAEQEPTLIGIDHCFSFPSPFLGQHDLQSWDAILEFAEARWATRSKQVRDVVQWADFAALTGRAGLRLTEQFTSSAKSVFNPNGAGVAFSSFAGLPWLRDLRRAFRGKAHFWPFDGWEVPEGKSCVAEVYPSVFSRRYENAGHPGGQHAHDAYAVCRWMRETDARGVLSNYFETLLSPTDRALAATEGWILGVM